MRQVEAGISQTAKVSCEKMMQAVQDTQIRLHILGNSAQERDGFVQEKEIACYKEFLKTRTFFEINELAGRELDE